MLAKYPGPVSRSFKSIPLEAGHFQKKLQPRGQKNQTRCKHKRTDVPDFWNTPKMTWDMVKLVNDGSKKKTTFASLDFQSDTRHLGVFLPKVACCTRILGTKLKSSFNWRHES